MKMDVGDGIFYSIVWIVIGTMLLGSIYMYHQYKEPEVHYYIPAEHKEAADKMWLKVYETVKNDTASPYNRATDAIHATYGVPFIANDNVKIPEDFVPPELPDITENDEKQSYNDF